MGIVARTASAAAALLLVCAAGQAQSRGAHMARPIPVVTRSAAPPAVFHSSAPAQTMTVRSVPVNARSRNARVTVINPAGTRQVFDTDSFQVPGLGFDFVHLAAINAGRHRMFRGTNFGNFGSFPFVEFPLFSEPFGGVTPQAAPPQVIVVQQPVPMQGEDNDAEATPRQGRRRYLAPAPEASPDPEPVHEAGEYVLVKRDGGLLFAVAFSVRGGQLNYITREGFRRTVALSAIDADATQQMNEQRGTPIHLPV